MNEYEKVLQYDIYGAIKIKGERNKEFSTIEEMLRFYSNSPAKIPNNPLLTNYEWVYEHVEELFCGSASEYQLHQGVEEYLMLFRVLIDKYSLEEDYLEYINGNFSLIDLKWGLFAVKLVEFIGCAFDDRIIQLLEKDEVKSYFERYPGIYTPSVFESFGDIGIGKLLRTNRCALYYINDYNELINLIRKHPELTIPSGLMLEKKIIRDMCRTHHIEDFYFDLYFVREQVSDLLYLEEHKKYCDEQIDNIECGILPCFLEKYNSSKEVITLNDLYAFNNMEKQVVKRIFELNGVDELSRLTVYSELSKYVVVGMFMSRNFETDPYNLLIDIETLYDFAVKNNKSLKGQSIYDFLISFESKEIEEIIDVYNFSKTMPLMDILYDDWNNMKVDFVNELNSKMFNLSSISSKTMIDGVRCFDISEVEEPILVHNTGIPINNEQKIKESVDRIKTGYKHTLCLSIQDNEHRIFYEAESVRNKKTIKLVYGLLSPERVGIISHEDSYSIGAECVEIDNSAYTRKLYTLKSLMDSTDRYNEIVYIINQKPFLPIGVICEDEITQGEVKFAEMLNIPVLYRKKKQITSQFVESETSGKQYSYVANKLLFKR